MLLFPGIFLHFEVCSIAVYCCAIPRPQATPAQRKGRCALIQELCDSRGGRQQKKLERGAGLILYMYFFFAATPPAELESGQSSLTKTLDPQNTGPSTVPTETDKRQTI